MKRRPWPALALPVAAAVVIAAPHAAELVLGPTPGPIVAQPESEALPTGATVIGPATTVDESLPGAGVGVESLPASLTTGQGPSTKDSPIPREDSSGAVHIREQAPSTTVPSSSVANGPLPVDVSTQWAIPARIVWCESRYRWDADNGNASGPYQITDATWAGYGGYARAIDAPPAIQHAKAAELWADGLGARHWQACL